MLRDNLVGLIEPMLSSAGANLLALCTERKRSSDDRPPCLENSRPEGAESTLTENAPSPFHAEPKQYSDARMIPLHTSQPSKVNSRSLTRSESTKDLHRRISKGAVFGMGYNSVAA